MVTVDWPARRHPAAIGSWAGLVGEEGTREQVGSAEVGPFSPGQYYSTDSPAATMEEPTRGTLRSHTLH